ncbi:hypothetical protein ABE607_17495 [Comamonas aquatica]|jgi:hypothetical protein|uniref:Uncharacterized protein n=1 Tax=Comamonas aquatica TaxID=225991 RepID=A0AA42L8L0_9BURK|nr:hypothetical protein [Comamonas aquatica]MDH0364696.1 hypothetical protein [Comamonas aquatica]WBM40497.1 hypothetical protein M2J84_09870 [Comamonas aquatica]CAB5682073.1 Uncharacterised protein [Comamonas aquatica]CAB5695551.1 Uncharacterised protein [Comamonas aquatica]CAC9217112.1 Uncharacterised protein [Comamonas aquatica]
MTQSVIPTPDRPDQGVEYGRLAMAHGKKLPLKVYRSNAGFYIGTYSDEGPFTRESVEYFRKEEQADHALATGQWTQKEDL